MNRPITDLPSVDVLGAWALGYWRDAPEITITTNQGEQIHRFVGPELDRTGVPYIFEFFYVLKVYQAHQQQQNPYPMAGSRPLWD